MSHERDIEPDWQRRAEAAEARVVELERREKLRSGHLPCGGCGGPHQFDTSVPSATWNAVIRTKGLSEFLCTNCILLEFVREGKSFTAELYGLGLHGTPVEFRVAGQVAKDAALVQDENNALRWKLHEAEAQVAALKAAMSKQDEEICQILGKALGYPWFKDDQANFPGATEEHGVCVGDEVAESLAMAAAGQLERLQWQGKLLRSRYE